MAFFIPTLNRGIDFASLEKALLQKDRSFAVDSETSTTAAITTQNDNDDSEDEGNSNSSSEPHRLLREMAYNVIHGQHLDNLAFFANSALQHRHLLEVCIADPETTFDQIHHTIIDFITTLTPSSSSSSAVELGALKDSEKVFAVLLLGITYLELYCQTNYTGPELNTKQRQQLELDLEEKLRKPASAVLECDGNYPYALVDMPFLLLLARALLSFVSDPFRASWQKGIQLDAAGNVSKPVYNETEVNDALGEDIFACLNKLQSKAWWSARALVLHARVLMKSTYDEAPTLWYECLDSFSIILHKYAGVQKGSNLLTLLPKDVVFPPTTDDEDEEESMLAKRMLACKIWLEWGLACHHFSFGDNGKKCFYKAKDVIQLESNITAAMGKRTKYQREDIAQLLLYAKSAILPVLENGDSSSRSEETEKKVVKVMPNHRNVTENNEEEDNGRANYEWEIGRRAVNEVNEQGEEAAIREVLLDTIDTGAAENIIIEGGPRFQEGSALNNGGNLHPLDQAVVLGLCLDVSNSNPVDGLTNEEMLPYIERVLNLAKNWMIHSTALLQRSWLEFERRKTMDRAMLQIQALIDQHTTRLTIFQSTFKSIEESAPAQDRLLYIYDIIYPSQFELKRDLATKYLQCQVFMSALNYFKELEMWDEVVTCYQLLQKPHRAELVVREQLKINESPYMVTALADLTGREDLYERAWEISKGRYPRAKRTLAKICHDRGDFEACCKHMDQALAVQPLVTSAWYLKGIASMKLNWWEQGLEAFSRCVQQDSEMAEAWTNMGAIYMRSKNFAQAYHALTEAAKHKRDDWRVMENLMMVTMALCKWKETIRHMDLLLDMRYKSQRPLHIQELQHLIRVVVSLTHATVQAEKESQQQSEDQESNTDAPAESVAEESGERSEARDCIVELPPLATSLENLLHKITNAIKTDPEVWDLIADFQASLGRYHIALESRMKQWRSVVTDSHFEKEEAKVRSLEAVGVKLVDALRYKEVRKDDIYSTKMLIQGMKRRLETLADTNTVTAADRESGLVLAYTVIADRLTALLAETEAMHEKHKVQAVQE